MNLQNTRITVSVEFFTVMWESFRRKRLEKGTSVLKYCLTLLRESIEEPWVSILKERLCLVILKVLERSVFLL